MKDNKEKINKDLNKIPSVNFGDPKLDGGFHCSIEDTLLAGIYFWYVIICYVIRDSWIIINEWSEVQWESVKSYIF